MTGTRPAHDAALYEALVSAAQAMEPEVRRGTMFGAPAIYLGRPMVGCVFGQGIGLKLPASLATQAIKAGRATRFTPYNRKPMKEWIDLRCAADDLPQAADLLSAAIEHAQGLGIAAQRKR
jgi:hypothetical protein